MLNEKSNIQLEELHRFNWEKVLNIKISEEQNRFVPPILYSIAQSAFEKNAKLYAINYDNKTAGFLMLLLNNPICWISRIIVDKNFQKQGIAYNTLTKIINEFRYKRRYTYIKALVHKDNYPAQKLFASLGFEPAGTVDNEILFELEL